MKFNRKSGILGFLVGLSLFGGLIWAGATFSRVKTWSSGETLTASDLNAEFNNILNNLTPTGIDDYSANTTEMRSLADPYPGSIESLATSLQGEIERLRYQVLEIKKAIQADNVTYWYQDLPTPGVFTIAGSSVGINDTTPSFNLDVNGSVGISTLTVSGLFNIPTDTNFTHIRSTMSANFDADTVACQTTGCPINLWVDEYDTNAEMGNTTFTVTDAGKYLVCPNLIFRDLNAVGIDYAEYIIYKNGVNTKATQSEGFLTAGNVPILFLTLSGCHTLDLAANDLIRVDVSAVGGSGDVVVEDSFPGGSGLDMFSSITIDRLF